MVWDRGGSAALAEELVDGHHTKSNSMLSNTLVSLEKRKLVAVTFGNLHLSFHQNTAPILFIWNKRENTMSDIKDRISPDDVPQLH